MANRKFLWTAEEVAVLITHYPIEGQGVSHRLPGRSGEACEQKARLLGLRLVRPGTTTSEIPTANRDIIKLLQDRAEEFERKGAHHKAKQGVVIGRPTNEPYGLLLTGDPHLDDPGCDILEFATTLALARKHKDKVLIANVGDLTNNWIGSLGRLYAHQTTTDDEAIELIKWMLTECEWAWVVLGNHDKWSPLAGLLCQQHEVPYVSHGGVFTIDAPGGRSLVIDCAHTHSGNSMYNASHAQVKRNYRGSRSDIIIGGHTHTGAHTILKNGFSGQVSHCIRLGSFKKYDDYADSKGFVDESLGASVLFTIDPNNDHPLGWIQAWYDIEAGIDYLIRQ